MLFLFLKGEDVVLKKGLSLLIFHAQNICVVLGVARGEAAKGVKGTSTWKSVG